MTLTYILIGVAVVLGLWLILTYNKFVSLVQRAKEALADIDVQMKRRYDLIPNLIEAVKGYMAHERQTLESVTNARATAMQAQTPAEHDKAENMLSDTLKSLFAVAENYPDLKANTNFLELQRELADTENKIQAARRFYNTNVRDLSIALESFPSNIVGNLFRFKAEDYVMLAENEAAAREPVKVQF